MTTAPIQTRQAPAPGRPTPQAPSQAMGLVSIDPIRMLRRHYPLLIGAAVLGAVLGAAAHFALLRVYPRWQAMALFQCNPPVTDVTSVAAGAENQDANARFMGTQVAIMTSDDVLINALKDPALERTTWASQFKVAGRIQPALALQGLNKDLSARVRANTNLIGLTMTWRKADDTAEVVNAVAKSYMQDSARRSNSESSDKRDALNKRLRTIGSEKDRVIQARERLLQENKITDLEGALTGENMELANIAETLVELNARKARIDSLQVKYQEILSTSLTAVYPDELVAETREDPIIRQAESEIAQLKVEERSLLTNGIGANHLAMQRLRHRIQASERELEARRDELLSKLFTSRLDMFRTELASIAEQSKQLEERQRVANVRKEDVVRIMVRVKQFNNELDSLVKEETDLSLAIKNLETMVSTPVFERVRWLRVAQTPDRVIFPKLKILVPLGVVLLTGLVAGIVVLRELLDQRVRGPADLAIIPRLTVLGMVPDAAEDPSKPRAVETAFRDTPGGVMTESFRLIRTPVMKRMDQEGRRSLVVMGGMPGSGATTVVCNLALACAGAGERVLVIDANLRRPAVHKAFKLNDAPGLGDVLAGQTTLDAAIQDGGVANLSVLTVGTMANRAVPERLSSDAMSRLLNDATNKFDRVIIDVPPAIVAGDGLAVANRADAVALVVRALNEKRGLVNRLRSQLIEAHAEMLGVIVNGVRASAGGYFKRNIQATHAYQTQPK